MNKLTVIQGGMAILLYKNHSGYSIIAACIAVHEGFYKLTQKQAQTCVT